MKKKYLNESHIRQIVKETLENLILGEDGMNDINPIEIIKNSTITDIDFIDMRNYSDYGHLSLQDCLQFLKNNVNINTKYIQFILCIP